MVVSKLPNHQWVHHLEWTLSNALSTHSVIVSSNNNYCSHEGLGQYGVLSVCPFLAKGCTCIILIHPQITLSC